LNLTKQPREAPDGSWKRKQKSIRVYTEIGIGIGIGIDIRKHRNLNIISAFITGTAS
jgi:hypothetical protein